MLWWTLRQLKSENGQVRRRAVERLSRGKDARATDALIGALQDSDPSVRQGAASAITGRGERTVPALVSALLTEYHRVGGGKSYDEDHVAMQLALLRALAATGDTRIVEPIAAMLEEYSFEVRFEAASVLVNFRDPRSVPTLTIGLTTDLSRERGVGHRALRPRRVAAANQLAKLGSHGILPLVEAIGDGIAETRAAAEAALKQVRLLDAQAVKPLLAFMAREHNRVHEFSGSSPFTGGKIAGVQSAAQSAVRLLQKCLEEAGASLAVDDLKAIAAREVIDIKCQLWCGGDLSQEELKRVDCSTIKQLARQELVRRGIQA